MSLTGMVTNRGAGSYYNAADLNRVEAATSTVAGMLTAAGYPVTITTKTDWTMADIPTASNMARYLGNVQLCITQFAQVPGVTLPSSIANLTYTGANNIEKVLLGLEEMIGVMEENYRRCGAYVCGQEG
jgi:hypothetical protein